MPVACIESIKPTEIVREEPPLDHTQQKQMASQTSAGEGWMQSWYSPFSCFELKSLCVLHPNLFP